MFQTRTRVAAVAVLLMVQSLRLLEMKSDISYRVAVFEKQATEAHLWSYVRRRALREAPLVGEVVRQMVGAPPPLHLEERPEVHHFVGNLPVVGASVKYLLKEVQKLETLHEYFGMNDNVYTVDYVEARVTLLVFSSMVWSAFLLIQAIITIRSACVEVSSEDEAVADEAPQDEAPQNEAPQDEAPQDEAQDEPQDEAPQDEAPQDEAPQDEAPQDEPQDEAPQDEAPQDEAPQDEPQDEPQEVVPQDEAPRDEAPQDEAPQDEAPQDEAPQDEAPQDEAPMQGPHFPGYYMKIVPCPPEYQGVVVGEEGLLALEFDVEVGMDDKQKCVTVFGLDENVDACVKKIKAITDQK